MLLVIVTVIEFLQSVQDEMVPNVHITFCQFLEDCTIFGDFTDLGKTLWQIQKKLLLDFPHWSEHTKSVYISAGKFIFVF